MVNPVAQLPEHRLRHVEGALRHQPQPDSLGTDKPRRPFHRLHQRLGRVVEEHVGLIEQQHQLGPVQVAGFRHLLEDLAQQVQQHGRVQRRLGHEALGGEHVDDATTAGIDTHQIVDVQGWLSKEVAGAGIVEGQYGALNCAQAGARHESVFGLERGHVGAYPFQHCPDVCQVEQRQIALVRYPEYQAQRVRLYVLEAQEPPQQKRPQVRDRGTQWQAQGSKHIPEGGGIGGIRRLGQAEPGKGSGNFGIAASGRRDARQIALHIATEDRHAGTGERLGQGLQGYRLACAGGSGHEAVPADHTEFERNVAAGIGRSAHGKVGWHQGPPISTASGRGHSSMFDAEAVVNMAGPAPRYSTRRYSSVYWPRFESSGTELE